MVAIHPQEIAGNWKSGIALDFHTTSSTPIGYNEAGYMQFDTVRPEIAELLYQLKYQGQQDAAQGIITAAAMFLRPHRAKLDLMIPVPPSSPRAVQPVLILARGIGKAIDLPVIECVTTTRATTQLKGVTDPEKRKELVEGLYVADPKHMAGKNVLLFDDLFRSGTTMNAITDVLLQQGKAASVRVLTITKRGATNEHKHRFHRRLATCFTSVCACQRAPEQNYRERSSRSRRRRQRSR